jgi:ubiquinone/menaquinone biosynthesis C-methylase UbiE
MAKKILPQPQDTYWADEETAKYLRLRIKTFYNADYFERIVLSLLDIPRGGHVLDVGCGYGGLSLILAQARPDLQVTGVDQEAHAVDSATKIAGESGLVNVKFEQGDGHQLRFANDQFEAVMCQTVLTHVRDAQAVVHEMARVLKPGGVFMAAEYTDDGAITMYDNVDYPNHDEAWYREFYRISQICRKGKKLRGYGDDEIGNRIPVLATNAGLDVFDMRLNDRALHLIPPYRHDKQKAYAEWMQQALQADTSGNCLKLLTEMVLAGGGSEAEAQWIYHAIDEPAQLRALEQGTLALMSAYNLYLTFARKRGS